METQFKETFLQAWQKYFNHAPLPIAFYYTEEEGRAPLIKGGAGARCVMGTLSSVRTGSSCTLSTASVGCFGGQRYLGFSPRLRPDFAYFLSCGIPGRMEGERYKKSPEIVKELMENWPRFEAPAKYLVFKRWDNLDEADDPAVVIFYASADVLAGLYTLASFDEADPNIVVAPMGSGCSSIVQNPFLESSRAHPRAILGMFDPSARPFFAADELSFAVPMIKFQSMVENMPESFLTTRTWRALQQRIP
jgi:hypothetical protein